jgi:serpin B
MALKARLPYRADDSFQVIELAYDDKLYSMVVLLPRQAHRLDDLEYALDADSLLSRIGGLERSTVQVYLPRFEIAGSWQIQRDLERLRVSAPFSTDADFSGIDATRRHRLSLLLHHASIRVDEAGTTADSVTSAMMVDKSLDRTTIFRADHPFLFLIRDNRNGDILFIGRVLNPAP